VRSEDLLSARRTHLERVVHSSLEGARPHSLGFAQRVLGPDYVVGDGGNGELTSATMLERAVYGGYPEVARAGFFLGGRARTDVADSFVEGYVAVLERFSKRKGGGISEFAQDDVAVLGVAEGVSRLISWGTPRGQTLRGWLLSLIDEHRTSGAWSARARDLAADLLDQRGRVRAEAGNFNVEEGALDLCLREAWPGAFLLAPEPNEQARQRLLESLLRDRTPGVGDLEKAVVWLGSLDLLVKQAAQSLVTSTGDVVRLLENTQSAMKRWVWDKAARRKDTDPARWLIDNEYHVQSFLWAVLYPIFGSDLRDEQYLIGYGLKQPRADLIIVSLKLIIEVKFAREKRDFAEIEEQVAGDLGLYFEDPGRLDRLVVYVYDDCDTPHPEQYDILKDALKNRDRRIDHVVVMRRPGMLPPRKDRKGVQG
jgi:hypothetical protein